MRDLDVICLGEALIDFVALQSGVSLIEAQDFHKAAGGAPANVAVGLARLGARPAFIGKVGDEPFGQFLKKTLDDNGVDTTGMVLDPNARTGLAFVSLTETGERDFVFFRNPSADMTFRPDELAEELIPRAHILHYGSISLIDEPARTTTLRAIELAREAGALLSYDPNLRLNLWPSLERACEGLREGLAYADVLKVSEEELYLLTGIDDREQAAWELLDQGIQLVAVTMGAEGCDCFIPHAQVRIHGHHVEAVDTTGAGDGFVAGMLAGILPAWRQGRRPGDLECEELDPICTYANAVGALTTTVRGAIPALPTADQVEAFLVENPMGV